MTVGQDRKNHKTYTTTAGLINGVATQRRLTQQLERRLHKSVIVSCPAVVPANNHDAFACTTWPPRAEATALGLRSRPKRADWYPRRVALLPLRHVRRESR